MIAWQPRRGTSRHWNHNNNGCDPQFPDHCPPSRSRFPYPVLSFLSLTWSYLENTSGSNVIVCSFLFSTTPRWIRAGGGRSHDRILLSDWEVAVFGFCSWKTGPFWRFEKSLSTVDRHSSLKVSRMKHLRRGGVLVKDFVVFLIKYLLVLLCRFHGDYYDDNNSNNIMTIVIIIKYMP